GVVKRVLDDARAAARLARGDLHGRVDGQSDGIVIGVSTLVGRREDGVGTNPAEEGKEAARELLKVLRGFAVRKVEMEAALRPDAGEAQGGESFAVAGAGVFMAGGEAVTLGVLHIARGAVSGMNDPEIADGRNVGSHADDLVIGVWGHKQHSFSPNHPSR